MRPVSMRTINDGVFTFAQRTNDYRIVQTIFLDGTRHFHGFDVIHMAQTVMKFDVFQRYQHLSRLLPYPHRKGVRSTRRTNHPKNLRRSF